MKPKDDVKETISAVNADLEEGLKAIQAQEVRLVEELAKVRAVKFTLLRALGRYKAPDGSLRDAILGVIGKQALSNLQIREAIKKTGYEHSLDKFHVSKTLTALVAANFLKRVGKGTGSKYTKV